MIEIPRDTVDHNTTDELTILYDEVLTTTDKLDSTLIRKTTEKRAEAVKKSLKLPPLISNATIKDVLMLMIEKCVKKRGQQFEIVINAEVLDKVFTQRKERHSTLSKVLSRKFGIHNF
ncbi:MAG: hypothetical protein LBP53_02605 [Candidatus Peribacteria bacterium]|jgi:hypothetical protein|nr:hypothetical protein [Candidatus Peribacteria bacterium]